MLLPLSGFLQQTIDRELPNLRSVSDAQASESPRGGWTGKQEVGHLIDSATNNHARFAVITLEDGYRGASYDQEGWVELHGYHAMTWESLVDFWYAYNCVIAKLVARIPEARLSTVCEIGKSGPITLQFLIEDYVIHMQHHIDQLLARETVTQYPQAMAVNQR